MCSVEYYGKNGPPQTEPLHVYNMKEPTLEKESWTIEMLDKRKNFQSQM